MFSSFSRGFFASRRAVTRIAAPTEITNLQIWYDVSNAGSLQVAGGSVNTWTDLNNGAKNAKATTNNQKPTYIASSLNGYPAIQFNGTTNIMSISPWNNPDQLNTIPAFTISMVARPLSYGTSTKTLITTNQNDFKIYYTGSAWAVRTAGGVGTSATTSSTVTSSNYHVFTLVYDGAAGSALSGDNRNNARLRFRIDRAEQALTWGGTVVSNLSNASNSTMYLGAITGGEYFNCEILEVTMFTRALNSNDITKVETYLSNHWNI
jgi:hypothetical protein